VEMLILGACAGIIVVMIAVVAYLTGHKNGEQGKNISGDKEDGILRISAKALDYIDDFFFELKKQVEQRAISIAMKEQCGDEASVRRGYYLCDVQHMEQAVNNLINNEHGN
jgi:hypothetical protein